MQTQLTNTRVQAQIAESQGEAELARAKKHAQQMVVTADAELARSRRQAEQTILMAEAQSKAQELVGRGESQRITQVGQSEADVLQKKIGSYGDPRLYALSLVTGHLCQSSQPLVPQHLFIAGSDGAGEPSLQGAHAAGGMLGQLIRLLLADRPTCKSRRVASASVQIGAIRRRKLTSGNLELTSLQSYVRRAD